MEVLRISVEVTCDSLVFEGKYYEKGEPIHNFPYCEKDHSKNAKPLNIIENVIEPIETEKEVVKEVVNAEVVEEKRNRLRGK